MVSATSFYQSVLSLSSFYLRNLFYLIAHTQRLHNFLRHAQTYTAFFYEHWTRIRTNNAFIQEIRRSTRVVGAFPNGNSALLLVCARLRHVAGDQWGNKRYKNSTWKLSLGTPPLLASFIQFRAYKPFYKNLLA